MEGISSERGVLRPHLTDVQRFPIFLSYGDEAKVIKDRIKRLIEAAINKQLSHRRWPYEFPVWDWRDTAAQKAPPGGKTNDLFVEMARDSSVTIVVLIDRVPPGTEEELLAVKDDDEVDLKVLWFPKRRRLPKWLTGPTAVQQLLDRYENDFKWTAVEDANSEDAWISIASNLISVLLGGLRSRPARPYVESR